MPFTPLGFKRLTGIFTAFGARHYFRSFDAFLDPAFSTILGYPFAVAAVAEKVIDGYLWV
jgi:hypothetical protein